MPLVVKAVSNMSALTLSPFVKRRVRTSLGLASSQAFTVTRYDATLPASRR